MPRIQNRLISIKFKYLADTWTGWQCNDFLAPKTSVESIPLGRNQRVTWRTLWLADSQPRPPVHLHTSVRDKWAGEDGEHRLFFLGHPMIDEPSCDSWRYSFHLLGHVTLSNQWQPSAVDLNFCAPNEGGSVNRCRQVEKQTFQEAPCDFQTLNTFRSSSGGMFKTTKVPPVGLDV